MRKDKNRFLKTRLRGVVSPDHLAGPSNNLLNFTWTRRSGVGVKLGNEPKDTILKDISFRISVIFKSRKSKQATSRDFSIFYSTRRRRKLMSKTKEEARYGLGLAVNTVKDIRSALKAAFNFAVDERLLMENPVKKTVIPPPPLSSANPLTVEEAWAFISVKGMFWYGDAFTLDLQTGARPEELMAWIWDDVDFDKGEIRIERACKWIDGAFTGFGAVKTRRSERVIELAPEHIEFLKAHQEKQNDHIKTVTKTGLSYGEPKMLEWIRKERSKQQHQYKHTNLIFPSQRGNVPNSNGLRASFKRMLRRAGLTGIRLEVRLYDLRHTHATILLTLGFPDHEVANRMGHTVDMLNNTYAHQYKGRQRRASSLFVKLIPLTTSGSVKPADIEECVKQHVEQTAQELEESFKKLLNIK
jgi:integrase